MAVANPASVATHDRIGPVRVGLVGRLLLAWTMAGSVVFGGFMQAILALTDPGRSTVDVLGGLGLFGFGAIAGFAHGCMLAWFGRPRTVGPGIAARRMLHGIVLAIPGTAVAMMLSVSIVAGPVGWRAGRTTVWFGGVVASLIAVGICVWASVLGVRAVGNALLRWPDRKPGVLIAAVFFAAVAALFLLQRPEIWGTDVRVTGLGAVLLAIGVTVWVAVPVEVLVLYVMHRRRGGAAAK